jgi:predicted regulator of Ras-like GTPase activity (Roadblock/LC7/MglB family)
MSRTESLNRALRNLQAGLADIEASALVSEDGLVIASALPQGVEETRVAAMSAAILAMAGRAAGELGRGKLEQVYVKGGNGYAILMSAGPHAVLLALARKEAKLGLIFFELSRASEELKSLLS